MLIQWIKQVKQFFVRVGSRLKKGQGLIEYALIILLLALVVIGALAVFGDQVVATYEFITTSIQLGQ